MKAIGVRELVKDYGGFRAVEGISFDVKAGRIFGLISPNGVAKTTVLGTTGMGPFGCSQRREDALTAG